MLKGSIFMKYRRILLKLSGEVLSGKTPIDFDNVMTAAGHIKALHDIGCEIGVVVGGGNMWRGRNGGSMDRNRADNIGMLATAMNSLALEQALIDLNVPVKVMSAVSMELFMDSYSARGANAALDGGKVVIFACGTGGATTIGASGFPSAFRIFAIISTPFGDRGRSWRKTRS